MALRHIPYASLAQTPWKNGQGITRQIAISPADAVFPEKFLWRLSCAEVRASNSFSSFAGYDRMLMVWKGQGLVLNDFRLEPLVPFQFRGEEVIQCELVLGPVVDLGLIFKRGTLRPRISVLAEWVSAEEGVALPGPCFLFCARGGGSVIGGPVAGGGSVTGGLMDGITLGEGDSVFAESPCEVHVSGGATWVLIELGV